jgi:hypothetical protein
MIPNMLGFLVYIWNTYIYTFKTLIDNMEGLEEIFMLSFKY